ncbi:flagellar biosynthesis anti-sigma factor FlgM [Paenibacillus contaminans]|uniref:Negative regulator of flagellin synthesis n=1 Tax=Paenibacillus contaminans TaxID=450362 RepID=A0A329MCJ1_9BACL|nr:flagellar biosynthesis anti-sigma factor FlgM [Paenibacillus contaminans]
MKINETQRINAVNPYKNNNLANHSITGKKGKRRDEVQISAEAQELLGTQRVSTQDQEVRNKKLNELKQSIDAGTYHRDARQIAEKILPYLK